MTPIGFSSSMTRRFKRFLSERADADVVLLLRLVADVRDFGMLQDIAALLALGRINQFLIACQRRSGFALKSPVSNCWNEHVLRAGTGTHHAERLRLSLSVADPG